MRDWLSRLEVYCASCAENLTTLLFYVQGLDWKDWGGIATIFWIAYQVNARRRLTEENIDKYLDDHLDNKLRDLKEERERHLEAISQESNCSRADRIARMFGSYANRLFWALLNLVRLKKSRPQASHAMLLLDAGDKASARMEFDALSAELLQRAKLYRKHASAKRHEAINAYVYAGRVAALQKDSAATLQAFNAALDLNKTDVGVRRLIGQQFLEVGDAASALSHFKKIEEIADRGSNEALTAEALRLQADAHIAKKEPGNAQRVLRQSLKVEQKRKSYLGIAETEEKLGDTFAENPHRVGAARRCYIASVQNYQTGQDAKGAERVRRKLRKLNQQSEDTRLSRLLDRFAAFVMRLAKRLRDRSRRR